MLLNKLVFMLSAEFSVMLGNFCVSALFLSDRLPHQNFIREFLIKIIILWNFSLFT